MIALLILVSDIPPPPVRFQGDTKAEVYFVSPDKLPALCGMKVEVGKTLRGCARWSPKQIFITNPCLSLDQAYAQELCHEIAHVNQWGDGHEP